MEEGCQQPRAPNTTDLYKTSGVLQLLGMRILHAPHSSAYVAVLSTGGFLTVHLIVNSKSNQLWLRGRGGGRCTSVSS